MEVYAAYLGALIAALVIGQGALSLYERARRARLNATIWMQRNDALMVTGLADRSRNRAALVWIVLASVVAIGGDYAADAVGVSPAWPLMGAAALAAYGAIPYLLLPMLMPRATAIADVVRFTVTPSSQEGAQLKALLAERLIYNETLETAPERAKVLWKRAAAAILANDSSYAARNREIAELQRCIEGGFPMPPVVEQRARRAHEKKWDALLEALD